MLSYIKRNRSEERSTSSDLSNCALLVNVKSGGRSGAAVGALFAECGCSVIPLLDTIETSHLKEARLEELSKVIQSGGFVVIAGGDGTASWGLEVIHECCRQYELRFPYVTLYPIGTGNDLSRSLGWGNKQPALKRSAVETLLHKYRKRFDEGAVSVLDRWGLTWTFTDPTNINDCWGRRLPQNFLCYVSIGYDARISLEFEIDRQKDPNPSPAKNVLTYIYHGASEFVSQMRPLTSEDVRIWVDGEERELPEGTRSLKILNINSAMNGLYVWGSSKSYDQELQDYDDPRFDDGKFEMIATGGVRNMIGYRLNYSHGHRVAQTHHVVWELQREMEIQVDGEAWVQKPCRLEFFLRDQIPVAVGKFGCRGVHTDVAEIHKHPTEKLREKRKSWVSQQVGFIPGSNLEVNLASSMV